MKNSIIRLFKGSIWDVVKLKFTTSQIGLKDVYKRQGYNIVLDVNSGSVHVVDDLCYDLIACLEAMNPDRCV